MGDMVILNYLKANRSRITVDLKQLQFLTHISRFYRQCYFKIVLEGTFQKQNDIGITIHKHFTYI